MFRKLKIMINKKQRIKSEHSDNESEKEDGLIIFRKSVSTVVKEYLNNSTLAGCKRIVEPGRHFIERLIWCIVISLAISGAVYIVKLVWSDFIDNPTVVSLETALYPIWKVPFPAVAICNVNKLSKANIEAFVQLTVLNSNRSIESAVNEIRNLGKLIDYDSPDLDTYEDFVMFVKGSYAIDVESELLDFKFLMELVIVYLSPSCEKMLLLCRWMGDMVDCNEFFEMQVTAEGYCCTFNYIPKSSGEKPKYLNNPGTHKGLSVVLDPQLEDYVYPLHISQGFKIHIFYTYDYPDPNIGNTVVRFIPVDSRVNINIVSRTMRSVPAVKHFSVNQRKCMFKDDLPQKFKGKYSFSNCILKCKRRIIRALCKCTPFFMPSNKNNSCGLINLPCLYKYKDKFRTVLTGLYEDPTPGEDSDEEPIDGLYCKDCYPDCTFTKYSVKVLTQPLMKNGKEAEILLNITAKNYSVAHIFFEDVDTELYKLDVVFYWFELVSNLGGICGLFLGLSFISIFEIVYFMTFRLGDELYKNGFSLSKCF